MESFEGTLIRTLLLRINELEDTVAFLESKLFATAKAPLSSFDDTLVVDSFDDEEVPIVPVLDWDFSTPNK